MNGEPRNPVRDYLLAFERRPKDESPRDFARRYIAADPDRALTIAEYVGSWPSSEPAIAAFQRMYP